MREHCPITPDVVSPLRARPRMPAATLRRTLALLMCVLMSQASWGVTGSLASPSSLDSCIALAEQRSPGVRSARQEVAAARARLRQALALDPPALSYEAGKLGTRVSGEEREGSLRLSQALPFPTQRTRAGRLARVEIELVESNLQSTLLRLRGEVSRAYRRLQADATVLRALQAQRATAADLEALTDARLRTGQARYLDVLRARAERARLENDIIEAERTLQAGRRTLNTLMARAPDELLEPADSLVFTPFTDSLSAVLAGAMRTRPRLRAARLELERQSAAVALAKSSLLPSAELGFGLDRVPGSDRLGVGAEATISLPFAPWTDRRGRVQEQEALRGGAEARREAAERSLESTIRNAYQAAQSSAQQVERFERVLLADAADALRTAVENYRFGQIDGLELFETIRTVRSIQLEHVRALLDYELARIDLSTAE